MTSEEFGSVRRKNILLTIVGAGLFILVGRLYQLQYIYRDEYGKKSEENSIRTVVKEPVRGYIYDRKGTLIVDNRPSYIVMLTPIDFDMKNLPLLSDILQMDQESISEKIKKARQFSLFNPTRLKRGRLIRN